jgi:hypothetical protein
MPITPALPTLLAPFPVGGIFLDSVRFTTDPETYEPLTWAKRYSIHQAIGGKVTIQDFGTFMKDNEIKIVSGNAQFFDQATVISLHSRWRTRGATFILTDWMENNFTVFIMEFPPVNFRPNFYRYSMRCKVVAINQLWGVTYTGT